MDTLYLLIEDSEWTFIEPFEESAQEDGYKIGWKILVDQLFDDGHSTVTIECYFSHDQLKQMCVQCDDEKINFEFLPNRQISYTHEGCRLLMFEKCTFEHQNYRFTKFDTEFLYDLYVKESSHMSQLMRDVSREAAIKICSCLGHLDKMNKRYSSHINKLNNILKSVEILVHVGSCRYLSHVKEHALQLNHVSESQYKMKSYDLTPQ